MRVEVCIYGEPHGKGRPKFSTVCGHPKARTPEKTVIYENLVQTEYRHQSGIRFPDDAMLDVRIFAYYAIPKYISKKKRQAMLDKKIRPTKKPDADNVCKVICDSLNGVAYRDDTQIVDCMVRKFYGEVPRVLVTIEDIKTD